MFVIFLQLYHYITMRFEILILTCLFGLIWASKNMTDSSSESDVFSEHSPERKQYSLAIWAQLDQKQKDCIKDKRASDQSSAAIKIESQKCFDKNGGLECIKAIPQLQPCFA